LFRDDFRHCDSDSVSTFKMKSIRVKSVLVRPPQPEETVPPLKKPLIRDEQRLLEDLKCRLRTGRDHKEWKY